MYTFYKMCSVDDTVKDTFGIVSSWKMYSAYLVRYVILILSLSTDIKYCQRQVDDNIANVSREYFKLQGLKNIVLLQVSIP